MLTRPQLADPGIRAALRAHLTERHTRESGAVVLSELGLCRGRVRVDLAVVNGNIHGYEIKSDRDSLRRLAGQIEVYGRVLNEATLVVGERHLDAALDLLPAWWSVLRAQGAATGVRITSYRRGGLNPAPDPRALVELLWLDDAMALLEQRQAARGIRGKSRDRVWDEICKHYDLEEIAAAVRRRLKARAGSSALPLLS